MFPRASNSTRWPRNSGLFIGLALSAGVCAFAKNVSSSIALWDAAEPFPTVEEIQVVPGVRYHLVHAQTPDFLFLHEPRLAMHQGALFVSFSNAPKHESEPAQLIRYRISNDNGATWSEPGVLAGGLPDGHRFETAPMLSRDGELYAFLGRYRLGGRSSHGMEVFIYDAQRRSFGPLSGTEPTANFIPFVQPQRLANGNWIIGGHADGVTSMAVAISHGADFRRWEVVRIPTPAGSFYPETGLWLHDATVTAVSRNDKSDRRPLVAVSRDSGATFEAAKPANFPMSDAKPFAGRLSTGERYLVFNGYPNRNADGSRNRSDLLIAVSRPGGSAPLCRVWRLIADLPPEAESLFPDETKRRDRQSWAYPEAVEHDGMLYVVFSHNKKHGWLATVPIASLQLR